ncbi:MAG: dTMP kinase [Desulfobulbaceae bacterium]|nr:MAG: dTMP kinase [Desulfobulbaceae bacterium]
MTKKNTGLFIVFEGIDGTGKSTQIKMLSDYLVQNGHEVLQTREPTDGPYGRKIRSYYTNREQITAQEELELFILDRMEHVRNEIIPALQRGIAVLCDRYYLSTVAYQTAAGLSTGEILEKHDFAPIPDLAFILEIEVKEAIRRITMSRGDRLNDFEQAEALQTVESVFKSLNLDYIRRINGMDSIENVHQSIVQEFDLFNKSVRSKS